MSRTYFDSFSPMAQLPMQKVSSREVHRSPAAASRATTTTTRKKRWDNTAPPKEENNTRERARMRSHTCTTNAQREMLLFGGGVFLCCIFKEKKRGRKGVAHGKEEEMGIEKDSTKTCKRVLATSGCSVCTID